MDVSNAGKNDLLSINNFIRDVTSKFEIGPQKIQVAVVPNECHQANGFDLNTHSTKPEVHEALQLDIKSNTVNVLKKLKEETFTAQRGARTNGTKRFAVLIVDETPGSLKKAEEAAADARKNGQMEIFVIGVGPKVNRAGLEKIASSPQHVLPSVKSYEQLEGNASLVSQLSTAICQSEYLERYERPCTFRFKSTEEESTNPEEEGSH